MMLFDHPRSGLFCCTRSPRKLIFRLFSASLLAILFTSGVAKAQVDPGLIQALHQATRNIQDQSTDLDALLWLSSMSKRLENRIKNPFYRVRLLKTIYAEAELNGLDPQLVLAVIDIESSFDRYAVSPAGAQGLMQVMPFWKEVYGRPNDDLHNPRTSIRYGCRILRHYLDRYENQAEALAGYNGSVGRSKYPDKIFRRLQSRWQYSGDAYSEQDDIKVALR